MTEQIRKMIEAGPLSQRQLAKLAGVNMANLNQFIGGKRGLSADALDRIGDVYGVKLSHDAKRAERLAARMPKPGRPKATKAKG
jgi:transcriptional regulator with XRE-family HTH domain